AARGDPAGGRGAKCCVPAFRRQARPPGRDLLGRPVGAGRSDGGRAGRAAARTGPRRRGACGRSARVTCVSPGPSRGRSERHSRHPI
ncbi:MAG: hypothetical protein AVDCRST_MAG55-3064, partial [uncultured Rubrobacteraceae bacterium]